MSGPEVRQIFKIRTVQKPFIFLPGRQTFNSLKIEIKIKKKYDFLCFFPDFFLFIWSKNFWHQICVQGPYLVRIYKPYLLSKMFNNISLDSVRSGRTCPANLGVRSCPVRKLRCPVRSSPKFGWSVPSISKEFLVLDLWSVVMQLPKMLILP